jgi:hypothetical protein
MHIVAIVVFITIRAGAVVTPKMLPIYLQFIFEAHPLKMLGLKTATVHCENNR